MCKNDRVCLNASTPSCPQMPHRTQAHLVCFCKILPRIVLLRISYWLISIIYHHLSLSVFHLLLPPYLLLLLSSVSVLQNVLFPLLATIPYISVCPIQDVRKRLNEKMREIRRLLKYTKPAEWEMLGNTVVMKWHVPSFSVSSEVTSVADDGVTYGSPSSLYLH